MATKKATPKVPVLASLRQIENVERQLNLLARLRTYGDGDVETMEFLDGKEFVTGPTRKTLVDDNGRRIVRAWQHDNVKYLTEVVDVVTRKALEQSQQQTVAKIYRLNQGLLSDLYRRLHSA